MKRTYFYTAVVLCCALLMTGCAEPLIPSEDAPAPAPAASPVTSAPEATAEPSVTVAPTPEPSTSDASELIEPQGETVPEYTDLSFLSQDQQTIYLRAVDFRFALFGDPGNLLYLDWAPEFRATTLQYLGSVEDYDLYDITFEAFEDLVHSVFTAEYTDSLGDIYTQKFFDCDGHLALCNSPEYILPLHDDVSRTALDNCPDTYRSGVCTENEVTFTLISHYDRNWQTSMEKDEMDIYTVEYPIRMVNTPDGWRIDEFHTTMYG